MKRTKKEIRELTSERLNEVIELKGIERPELLVKLSHRLGEKVQRQKLFQYLTGYIQTPERIAEMIADILNIDYGYLIGADDFTYKSYAEYEEGLNLHRIANRKAYKFFVESGLFSVGSNTGNVIFKGKRNKVSVEYYTLNRPDDYKKFTPEELEQFYQAVIKFMTDYYENFVESQTEEEYEPQKNDIEKIKQYRKDAIKNTASNKVKKGVKK